MTTNTLIVSILKRINKLKIIIILIGILMGILLYMFGKKQLPTYSIKSSLYPLNAVSDKNSSASKLTELIGGTTNGKSLTDEANVNIEEVAKSRKTREAVCGEKLKAFDNKTIGELLILEYNKHKGYFSEAIEVPKNIEGIKVEGGALLEDAYVAKFNKLNLLEISYSNVNKDLLTPISYALIAKISQFYKELKVKKAQIDYDFMLKKHDSLTNILESLDQKQISLNERSLFIKQNQFKYKIPEQNIQNDRLQILAQKNNAAANLEEAHWRLEKVTPVIEILDKPDPPFKVAKKPAIFYGIGGFIFGLFLAIFLFTFRLLFKYSKSQVSQSLASKLTAPQEENKILDKL